MIVQANRYGNQMSRRRIKLMHRTSPPERANKDTQDNNKQINVHQKNVNNGQRKRLKVTIMLTPQRNNFFTIDTESS